MKNLLAKIKCRLGWHEWFYSGLKTGRVCGVCSRRQVLWDLETYPELSESTRVSIRKFLAKLDIKPEDQYTDPETGATWVWRN